MCNRADLAGAIAVRSGRRVARQIGSAACQMLDSEPDRRYKLNLR